jgi:hypothetical protein
MAANAVYFVLLLGNILLIVASLIVGPRLLRVCRAALLVNAIALMLMLVPLLNLLLASHPSADYRAAIKILLTFTAPILVELLALLAVLRWLSRMVQGMGAPRTSQELNAKADEVMAVFLFWHDITRRDCSVN